MIITKPGEKYMGFGSGVGSFMTALKLMGVIKTNNLPEPTIPLTDIEVQTVEFILKKEGLL